MTRGSNRHDPPSASSSEWIDYSCPVESWEFWEERFSQTFPQRLRNCIALQLTDFRASQKDYVALNKSGGTRRLDAKQIGRELKAAEKRNQYPNLDLQRIVELHSMHLPDATIAEKASCVLEGFSAASNDFLMERANPKPLFTRCLYQLFHDHSLNVSCGSAADLYAISQSQRDKGAPETAFVEFVRRTIWKEGASVRFCSRIQKEIQRAWLVRPNK